MENKIIEILGEAWNEYLKHYQRCYTPSDSDDLNDFRKCIHDAQRIVMAKEGIKKHSVGKRD